MEPRLTGCSCRPSTGVGAAQGDETPLPYQRVARDPSAAASVVESPYRLAWPSPFKPYQLEAIRALISNEHLLLADDMGLGKTIQAIAALRVMTLAGTIQQSLLIVPASITVQWRQELAKWAPELEVMPIQGSQRERAWQWDVPAHVAVVSYETFRSDFGLVASPRLVARWDLVVIDEAQKIKNRGSEMSRKVEAASTFTVLGINGYPAGKPDRRSCVDPGICRSQIRRHIAHVHN